MSPSEEAPMTEAHRSSSGNHLPHLSRHSAPTQAATTTRIKPGIKRNVKNGLPLLQAKIILLIVLVETPARIGNLASNGTIFPDTTIEATAIAAEWVST